MKKLILVRHAKSSWEHDVIDHERPLNKRGVNDANLVSKKISKNDLKIDMVLSSDAMRAKTTADIFVANLNIDKTIFSLNHDLYDFAGNDLLRVIKSCDNSVNNLMVFGHNHAITGFVNTHGSISIDNVPTSGVTIIEFDIDNWKDLKKGKTTKTLFPRDLK
ncbi:histidine phosphatase family protein [Flaviramulus sp. BrNp1-15]|uniref:SixA phosphatase family protein n=1 Tax=Flaviramulus sp. BrNp1-15 TaxID=2916754 RepID=UPI001EE8F2B1|nr:histidine phosphatase family protein [Flaviramulus sp. BrNp1-15]ULC58111.1 histidine phosphatase family protein [Flaviramulus sp. BrNp1-15]